METHYEISLEELSEPLILLVTEWLVRPHVARLYFSSKNEEERRRKLQGYLNSEFFRPFLIKCEGKYVGYVQIGMNVDEQKYGLHGSFREIDLFIGEPEYLKKGIGSAAIQKACDIALSDPSVTGVLADPDVRNADSIKALERCGFHKCQILEEEEGLKQIMVLRRGSQ